MKTDGSDQNTKGRDLTPQQREVATLRGELQKMTAEFDKALAGKITPDRMVRIILTAVQTTPKLAECSRVSFFGAVMQSCQLALEPNTPLGQAYLIPRWNGTKKCLECNFQLGYQGILDLAYRTDKYKRIAAEVVYEGDKFDYEYGLDSYLRHKPDGKSDKPLYVYALYELKNGGREFKVWTWEKIMQHAEQFSESFDKSFAPWKSNPESQEGMAKKTVLINLLKYAPKSAEIASAVNADERILSARRVDDGGHSFVSIDVEDIPTMPVEPEVKDETTPPAQNQSAQPAGNGAAATPAQAPTATAANGGQPVAQGNGNSGNPLQNGAPPNSANGKAGNGKRNGQLFGADEDADMQEAYERHMAGAMGPDFG
ncbi:MAG: recombinase RecT [Oscillospiraceae bacterium]|nr:recombinase RecT [Oscillospiraceae bacterium]